MPWRHFCSNNDICVAELHAAATTALIPGVFPEPAESAQRLPRSRAPQRTPWGTPFRVEGQSTSWWHTLCGPAARSRPHPEGAGAADPRGEERRHDHRRRCYEWDEDGSLLEQRGEEAALGAGQGAKEEEGVHAKEPPRVSEGGASQWSWGQEGDQYLGAQSQKDDEETKQKDPG